MCKIPLIPGFLSFMPELPRIVIILIFIAHSQLPAYPNFHPL